MGEELSGLLDRLALLCEDELDRRRLGDLRRRLDVRRLRVLVAGEAKRGKSTLVNAIVGSDLLPRGTLPLTSVSTEVESVPSGRPAGLQVQLADGTTVDAPLTDLARIQGSEGVPGVEGVRRLVARVDSPLPHPRMTLIDTPGVGSVRSDNDEQARAAYESMDLVLFVLTGDSPLSAAEARLLCEVAPLAARVWVVLNKVDLVAENERDQVTGFVRRQVRSAIGTDLPVLLVSAAGGLAARLANDQQRWRASGMEALVEEITTRLEASGERDLVESLALAARRVSLRMTDRAELALAAHTTAAATRRARLLLVTEALAEAERRAGEAEQVVTAGTRAQQQRVSEAAHAATTELAGPVRDSVQLASDLSPAEAETAALAQVAETTSHQVLCWYDQQRETAAAALDADVSRQQALLSADSRRLTQATQEALGVVLQAPAVQLPAVDLPRLHLDLRPGVAWNAEIAATLRRHGPGARARVSRHVEARITELVDRNVGRARSTLQQETGVSRRALAAAVRSAYDAHRAGLGRARDVLASPSRTESATAELRRELDALRSIDTDLDHLLHHSRHLEDS